MRLRFSVLLLLLLATGCVHAVRPVGAATLEGARAALLPGPAVRLAMAGAVGQHPAEVQVDITAPISLVTTGCLESPRAIARVTMSDPLTGDETLPLTRVAGFSLGGVTLRTFDAALLAHDACVLSLGMDLLGEVAMEVSPSRREVHFLRPRSREAWRALAATPGEQLQLVELAKEPTYDWPLLVARVVQGDEVLVTPFVLGTRDWNSRVFEAAARGEGLKTALELIEAGDGKLPQLSPEAKARALAYPFNRLELSPGIGVSDGLLAGLPGAAPRGVAGVLGPDVWARFEATIDLSAGLLALRRPRVQGDGARYQCSRGGTLSDEACFQLTQVSTPVGVLATVTVWRPLREGGRLYLDADSGSASACRIGVTFAAGDAGRSSQHLFPWKRLFEAMPGCARALTKATSLTFAFFEDGELPECPGVCGFAQDLRTGRLSCECQPGSSGLPPELERTLFNRRRTGTSPGLETEPGDP